MFTVLGLVIVPILVVLFVMLFVVKCYKRCGSDEILIISGKLYGKYKEKSSKCLHGGGALVIPLLQQWTKLSLRPFSTDVDLRGALSQNNIRVNVPSTFTVAISPESDLMENAAQRLVGLNANSIENQANEIIFGQLRAAIATMTIEEINADRDAFMEAVEKNLTSELTKIGLKIINVNIKDITDESGYIEAIGRKAAAEAINKANIDVAEQEKTGQIGVQTAQREQQVQVAEQISLSEQGTKQAEKEKRVKIAEYEASAVEGENKSSALKAEYDAILAEKKAESKKKSQVAEANAEKAILEAEKAQEKVRLEKETIVKQEIAKREKIIYAEAEAESMVKRAEGEAAAILAKYEAEANGQQMVLEAKAKGYKELFATVGEQKHLIPTMELVKCLPEIVKIQVEAIKNIKIDKVTVWDSGNGKDGKTSTANFLSGMIGSLPQIQELAKQAGVELPEFMGKLIDDTKSIEKSININ